MFGSTPRVRRRPMVTLVPVITGVLALGLLHPCIAAADTALHSYTLVARSIHVNDDGDAGVYGAGDFHVMNLWLGNQNNAIHIDNGHGWSFGVANRAWQHYASDTTYPIPAVGDANTGYGTGAVGQSVKVTGVAHEIDNLNVNEVRAKHTTTFTVPPPGTHQDFSTELEATNGKSHIRLTITFRITTS